MRISVAALLSIALLLSACTSSETVDLVAEEGAGTPATLIERVVDEPVETTTTSLSTLPEERPFKPTDYLLQPEDLPGWRYVRSMDFDAEPTFELVGCELMETAWGAHGSPGTRIRASAEGVSFRQTVVEMPDEASAEAIVDAAEVVWRECNPLTIAFGSEWWVEPIQLPEVEGWRTAGLALGTPEGSIWTISWFQQGTTVVFLDLDSESPWSELGPVQQAVAARLNGETADAPAPTSSSTPDTTTPGTRPPNSSPKTSPTAPSTTERQQWRDHSAAGYVPDAAFFGPGFELDYVTVEEEAPSDPNDDIEGCAVAPPPTMDGLKAEYEHEAELAEVEVTIGINHAQWAQDTVDAFREVGDCDPALLGVDAIVVTNPESDADDVVVLDITSGVDAVRALFLVARYDDMMVVIYFAVEDGGTTELPTVDTMTGWADEIAARS